MAIFGRALRRGLDKLYLAAGVAAAGFLVVLLLLVVAQMAARWFGLSFPGSAQYAGYAMASASFLAFAHALNRGAHIRVTLVLSKLGRFRYIAELWCFAIATALACYFAYYAARGVSWSYALGDVSQGQDATPLWIPQLSMAVGTAILGVAFADHLVRLIVLGRHGIEADLIDQSHGE